MAWVSFDRVASTTLNGAAAVAALIGVFALGVGIGSGCTLLIIATFAVIFPACLVPSLVDVRDTKRRVKEAARPKAPQAATAWRAPEWDIENIERETYGDGLVWIEPQADRQRLH
jgi:hypothetical protein